MEDRGARPPRLPFGAPRAEHFAGGHSCWVGHVRCKGQRRGRRWLHPRRVRSPARSRFADCRM